MTEAEVCESGPRGATLHAAVQAVTDAARAAQARSGPERADLIGQVDRAIAVLTTVRSELLVAERDSGAWKRAGDRSYEAWRARTSRSGMRAATAEVRRADTLQAMPAVRQATELGQVSVEHVDVMAKAAAHGSAPVRAALASPQGQAEVLGLARRVDAGAFARSMALWAATLDAGALERTHQAQRGARFLYLTDTDGGTRISGQLDRMAGHGLRLALEAVSGRPAADDDRSSEQRRADALQSLAERVLALPETGSGAAVRPHVSFLMSAETWAALRAHRGVGVGAQPAVLEDGTPVPPSEVARALCDCELTRIVLDATDEPINLGRTARTYTGAQRRAVIARDGGCLWPSCDREARWCEVHHIKWWDRDGGETSVVDGALACSFHHHEIHRLGLSITRHVLVPGERGHGTRRVRYSLALPDGTVLAGSQDGAVPLMGPEEAAPAGLPDGVVLADLPDETSTADGQGGRAPARLPDGSHRVASTVRVRNLAPPAWPAGTASGSSPLWPSGAAP